MYHMDYPNRNVRILSHREHGFNKLVYYRFRLMLLTMTVNCHDRYNNWTKMQRGMFPSSLLGKETQRKNK
jgi:hypothetical protein